MGGLSPLSAALLVLLAPAPGSAAGPQQPAAAPRIDPELLLFLAEFADAEGELPSLELLDHAADSESESDTTKTAAGATAAPQPALPEAAPIPRAARAAPTPVRPTPRGDLP
jgi:hypothetical protein